MRANKKKKLSATDERRFQQQWQKLFRRQLSLLTRFGRNAATKERGVKLRRCSAMAAAAAARNGWLASQQFQSQNFLSFPFASRREFPFSSGFPSVASSCFFLRSPAQN